MLVGAHGTDIIVPIVDKPVFSAEDGDTRRSVLLIMPFPTILRTCILLD